MIRRKALIIVACIMVVVFVLGGLAAYIGQDIPASSAAITKATQTTAIYPISPRKAALIALRATPGATLVEAPSVVSFQGVVAYEVQLDSGIVYVDAYSGQALYNGAKPTNMAPAIYMLV